MRASEKNSPLAPTARRRRTRQFLTRLALLLVLAGFGPGAGAQILVSNTGAGPITFNATPALAATEWATIDLTNGNSATYTNAAQVDAAAQTFVAGTITNALERTNIIGTARLARHHTNNTYIYTEPTGVPLSVIKATLQNNSGSANSAITVSYNYSVIAAPVTDECPGQRVFYSVTGASNSWQLIPELSGKTNTALLTAGITLVATWAPSAPLYLLWLDDNNVTGAEGGFAIDNFSVALGLPPCPGITNQPSNLVVAQCAATPVTFTVGFTGVVNTVQWERDGGGGFTNIPGANSATFTLTPVTLADSGSQFRAVLAGASCTVTSSTAGLTIVADTNSPVVLAASPALSGSNQLVVIFNEPVSASSAGNTANYSLLDTTTALPLTVLGATNLNATTVLLDIVPALDFADGYELTVSSIADACAGNVMPSPQVLTVSTFAQTLIALDATALWKYHQSGLSLSNAWIAPGYNDVAWLTGAGTFDAKRTNATAPLPLCRPVLPTNGEPVRTCLTLSNATSTAQIPTVYFRKHFLYSDGTNGVAQQPVLRVVSLIDDGAVYYLNGVELARLGMPAGTISYGTLASRTVTEPAYETNYFSATALQAGLNVFAVELHQVNLTSSDLTFGMQLDVLATAPPAPLAPAIFVQPSSVATALGSTAVFNVNVGGTGPFTYQWHVNCRDIPNATNASLTISNATPADVGTYSVTVADALGQVTSWDAALEIPGLGAGPAPTLHAALNGANVTLTWPAVAGSFQLQEAASLDVLPAAWSNSSASISLAGTNYSATVAHGGAKKFFRLTGAPFTPRILTHPLGRSANLGDAVTLSVTATGAPPLAYVWRFNGQNLPASTNATLTVTLTNATQFGAYAAWVIEHGTNELLSRPAVLRPAGLETNGADLFANRPTFTGLDGSIHGLTFGATKQAGEPDHAGKPGGRSVWIQWSPPTSGIATFDTYGSGFDTLLAAYSGGTLSNLTLLAGDDDSGANVGGRVQFNVSTNVNYQIAVDGLAGAGGFFVLNWSLDPQPASVTLPVIDAQPHDAILNTNVSVATNFTVVAHGLPPLTALSYQWYRDGVTLTNATNATLIVGTGGVPLLLGNYSVDVQNSARVVRSRAASLQFSTDPGLRFWPKPDVDLICGGTAGNNSTNCCGASLARGGKDGPPPSFDAAASGTCSAGALTGQNSPASSLKWKWVTDMQFTNTAICTLTFTAKSSGGSFINGRIYVYKKESNGTLTLVTSTASTLTTLVHIFVGTSGSTYHIATGSANTSDTHTLTYSRSP